MTERPMKPPSRGAPALPATAQVAPAGGVELQSGASEPSDVEDVTVKPVKDPHDQRAVCWFGKRLYLGEPDTQIAKLFDLLTSRMGHAIPWDEVRKVVFNDKRPRNQEQVKGHLRTVVSKLRDRLKEHRLDDHVIIMCENDKDLTSYSMHFRSKAPPQPSVES
jgi:hypothetical protein